MANNFSPSPRLNTVAGMEVSKLFERPQDIGSVDEFIAGGKSWGLSFFASISTSARFFAIILCALAVVITVRGISNATWDVSLLNIVAVIALLTGGAFIYLQSDPYLCLGAGAAAALSAYVGSKSARH